MMAESHNIVSIFEKTVALHSENAALIFQSTTINYHQLNEIANQLARHLVKIGVTKGSMVAICVEQCLDRPIFMLAVMKSGAVHVNLDPEYPIARMDIILEDTQASFLLTTEQLLPKFSKYQGKIVLPRSEKNEIAAYDMSNLQTDISPCDDIYVIYTSGSTGKPKGVVVQHGGVFNCLNAYIEITGVSSQSITIQLLNYCFDVVYIDMWAPLLVGGTVHMYPNNKLVGAPMLKFIEQHSINFIPAITPSILASFPTEQSIGDLKVMGITGEICPERVFLHWVSKVKMFNIYGPTETTIAVTCHKYQNEQSGKIIGKALPGVEFYVLDSNLKPTPEGEPGELFIGGVQLAKGYLHDAELTAKRFIYMDVTNELDGRYTKRLYKSGDIVKSLPDGNIEIIGRADTQVKVNGYRIECGEIENVIQGIKGIKQAVVVVMNRQNGRKILAAFIILNHLQTDENMKKNLPTILRTILPIYMIPNKISFVDQLPRLNSGKVDRKSLQEALNKEELSFKNIKENDIEGIIMVVWRYVLHQDIKSITDDFFVLGGTSFDANHSLVLLPQYIRDVVTIGDLYIHSTVEDLSKLIKSRLIKQLTLEERSKDRIEAMFADIKLDADYEYPTEINPEVLSNPKKILLTGTTGFVGIHLLVELLLNTSADIYCLLRNVKTKMEAINRIKFFIKEYKIMWPENEAHRIIPVSGDLSCKFFQLDHDYYIKLTKEIEIVYHIGGNVNFNEPYPLMRPGNIFAIQNVITFASTNRLKYVITSSTISVFSFGQWFTKKLRMSEDYNIDENLPSISRDLGYVQSKYVVEKIIQLAKQKGLPVIVFRPGFILCHSVTGACSLDQWGSRLNRCCMSLRAFPTLLSVKEQLVTVDFVVKAMIHICKNKDAVGKYFHLTPHPVHDISETDLFTKFNEYFGMNLVPMHFKDWLNLWKTDENNPLFGLVNLYIDEVYDGKCLIESYENCYYYERENTEKFLEGSGIEGKAPLITKEVLSNYLNFLNIPH